MLQLTDAATEIETVQIFCLTLYICSVAVTNTESIRDDARHSHVRRQLVDLQRSSLLSVSDLHQAES